VRRAIFLGLVAAFATACGSSESAPTPPAPAPETTTDEEMTTEAAPPPPTRPKRKPKAPPGVPGFVAGYRGWVKLNDRPLPLRDSDPHAGTKNVFASRRPGRRGLFPHGAIVVKEAVRPGADFIGLIAIMRKQKGADPEHNDWVFVEYTRDAPGARFGFQAEGAVCYSCHVGAEATDYVFTLAR
jgi:hypothetical protein